MGVYRNYPVHKEVLINLPNSKHIRKSLCGRKSKKLATNEDYVTCLECLEMMKKENNDNELKCPKCGGESIMTPGYAVYLFECKKCGEYMVSFDPLLDAIAAWNGRTKEKV